MANNVSQNHAPDFLGAVVDVNVGGVVDVAGPLIGRSIIDGLRRKFSPSGQMQLGDYDMDRSRDLLRRHLQLMEVNDQDTIRKKFDDARDIKDGLENSSGTLLKRLREARRYRRHSKVTYRIVKRASERGMDGRLMDQIAESIQQRGSGSGSEPDTGPVSSILTNPFADSHAISTLTDVAVKDLDRVEMTAFQDRNDGEGAVVLGLVARDQTVQHVVATFPTEAFSGERTDRGASQSTAPEVPAALSLHRDDGTIPRFVTASQPDVSLDQRADEEVETGSTTSSYASMEIYGTSERNRPSLETPP